MRRPSALVLSLHQSDEANDDDDIFSLMTNKANKEEHKHDPNASIENVQIDHQKSLTDILSQMPIYSSQTNLQKRLSESIHSIHRMESIIEQISVPMLANDQSERSKKENSQSNTYIGQLKERPDFDESVGISELVANVLSEV
ncbi:hypothetical protein RFI_04480 [Reticulomyxa filosa]|uniref:Uncharacterized protein n=1 Tax=Reticulomyxa filosa TaxID=46433 RepID=X6P3H0_RETFI|nr:hypothetical protein RFI_04480 [Reticulomyxa filosa]|eukprot:ETO32634.1 hypothetical protein RFI_04480 [Reticulomyxa filosa]